MLLIGPGSEGPGSNGSMGANVGGAMMGVSMFKSSRGLGNDGSANAVGAAVCVSMDMSTGGSGTPLDMVGLWLLDFVAGGLEKVGGGDAVTIRPISMQSDTIDT